jgi:hypothetical protein
MSSHVTYPERVGCWRLAESSQKSDRPGGNYELDTVDRRVLVSVCCPHYPSYVIDDWPVKVHDMGENRLILGYFSTEAEAVAGAVEYMAGNVPSWAGVSEDLPEGQQQLITDGGTDVDGTERSYNCVRCREKFETEKEVIDHLKTEHEGESDGRYDYSVNITGEFP